MTSVYVVIPARPLWMAEVLETQEQFPVQSGIQICSPHGAQRNPGIGAVTEHFPRIPLRSMRATCCAFLAQVPYSQAKALKLSAILI